MPKMPERIQELEGRLIHTIRAWCGEHPSADAADALAALTMVMLYVTRAAVHSAPADIRDHVVAIVEEGLRQTLREGIPGAPDTTRPGE